MASNIDHISISAPREQFDAIVGWYKAALAPLKYRELERWPTAVGLGAEVADLWVVQEDRPVHQELHFALGAPVDAFYQAALAAGGVDNGKPGVHHEYDEDYYYGSFVLDPLGNNVEVVDHCSHDVEYR